MFPKRRLSRVAKKLVSKGVPCDTCVRKRGHSHWCTSCVHYIDLNSLGYTNNWKSRPSLLSNKEE